MREIRNSPKELLEGWGVFKGVLSGYRNILNYGICILCVGCCIYVRGAQPFLVKGRSIFFSTHSRAKDKIMILTFESRVSKTQKII